MIYTRRWPSGSMIKVGFKMTFIQIAKFVPKIMLAVSISVLDDKGIF